MRSILFVGSNSKEDPEMKNKILLALGLSISLFLPSLALAECMHMGEFSRFGLEGQNTVTLYFGSMPTARFDIQNCNVQSSSKIQLLKTDVCDGDEILIDGERCVMLEIKPLGP